MTFESVERLMQYNPASVIHHISPTPFCMIVAENDVLTPTDLALSAYQNAREPKRCVVLPGGHFDAYTEGIDMSSGAAIDWFAEHLKPATRPAAAKKATRPRTRK
jgi:uncharacterized protein